MSMKWMNAPVVPNLTTHTKAASIPWAIDKGLGAEDAESEDSDLDKEQELAIFVITIAV
jgi:hypothetical protein